MGLPSTFVDAICKRRSEENLNGRLHPCAGGIESNFFRRIESCSTDVFQTVFRIPMTGAAVLDKPLLIYIGTERDERIISNGDVFDKLKIVETFLGIYSCKDGWQRSRLNHNDCFRWVDDQSRLDQWSL